MPAETVRIEELQLHVPGLSREEAQRLGEEVARLIADALPLHGHVEHLGALDLRLSVPHVTPRNLLAQEIAQAIIEKLL